MRTFKKGEMVLTRLPGLQNKLEGGYEGPYEILEVPNDVHVIIGIPGKAGGNKIKRVHINSCKLYNQVQVCRVAVWAREDEIVDSVDKKLEGDVLTDYRQKELDAVLQKWCDVLSDIPGKTDILKHDIRTGDSLPVRSIPYQIPSKWRSQVKEELEKMQEQGILRSSTSAWSAPIVPVPKKSGEIRVCGDFRKLNKITEVDSYHIPLISEIIERVGNSSVLSKMDMCKGFHQVAMADDAREKTAIVTPFGKMEYSRMPFGLVNATSTFQRLMDIVLDGLQNMCSAYVDDIIVYSGSWEEHLKDIDTVLGKLKKAGLTAKPSKCEWGKQYLVFLGHKIGGGKVTVPENRARSVAEYVRPKNKKGVRAFLGLAGYYRRFVPNFGSLAVPLTKMTKKGMPDCVEWTQAGVQAFTAISKSLVNTCSLTIPLSKDSYRLQTDACGTGIGAVLSVVRNDVEFPVAFYSRQLRGAELNYSAMELECLGVVCAIKNFEVYIAGQEFELVTDHQALIYLSKSKNHHRRLMRWSIFLQDLRFQAIYRPGYMNGNADGLSRQDWDDTEWSSHGTGVKRESTFSGGHSSLGGGDVVDHPTTGTLNT